MSPELIKILTVMCDMVEADFNEVDFTSPFWYNTYEWTEDKKNTFILWLVKYLKNNKDARFEVGLYRNNKKALLKVAKNFVFNYGWKIKL